MIDHEIDTRNAPAGSSLYIEEDGKYYIFGLHVRGHSSESLRKQAIFLNEDRIRRIKEWISDYYRRYHIFSEIDLSDSPNIYREVVIAGYNSFHIRNLEVLNLRSNQITNSEAIDLARVNFMSLTTLDLSGNLIKVDGITALSQKCFINLTTLDMSNGWLRDRGAIALSKADLKNIRSYI